MGDRDKGSGKGRGGRDAPASSDAAAHATRQADGRSVGWALIQAARLHRARIGDRLAELGLFAGQEQVMQALAANGTMTMGDLAALLRVRPPTASKTVTRLAALGVVERRAESGDGRVVRVQLTAAGLAKAEAITRIQEDVEAELLAHLDKGDRRRLRKLLRRAARGLADAAGATGQGVQADPGLDAVEDEAGDLPT